MAAYWIAEYVENDCLIVVKSTVPVGTNDKVEECIYDLMVKNVKVEVGSNLEFLSQGTAVCDMFHVKRIVIGTNCRKAERILREIYEPSYIPIVSIGCRSAEIIKYVCSDFLVPKIFYMNEIANLCELVGADIYDVTEGMKYDPRIGKNFLKVGIGYGGFCFPKDAKTRKFLAKQNGYVLKTVEATVVVNEIQKVRLLKRLCSGFLRSLTENSCFGSNL